MYMEQQFDVEQGPASCRMGLTKKRNVRSYGTQHIKYVSAPPRWYRRPVQSLPSALALFRIVRVVVDVRMRDENKASYLTVKSVGFRKQVTSIKTNS